MSENASLFQLTVYGSVLRVVVSLDGAYILMREDGYREAMVGNISLYDVAGKRQHTVYIGEAPEYVTDVNYFSRPATTIFPVFLGH